MIKNVLLSGVADSGSGRHNLVIRNKLYDFIRVADVKKLHAIYNLLQNDIDNTLEWWKDKSFTSELHHRYQSLEIGTDKGYTIDKLQTFINKLRKISRI